MRLCNEVIEDSIANTFDFSEGAAKNPKAEVKDLIFTIDEGIVQATEEAKKDHLRRLQVRF